LEVLDWGGSVRAVVLLAGYQTAHEYDDIAAKLTVFCHVYGITRRGFGASSRPDSGYTAQRSAEDVLQVLDALKLDHPVLAGHSFGGLDLLTIAAQHPALVAGLVFLDSGDDPTLTFSAYGVAKVDTKKLPASMTAPEPPPDYSSFQAFGEWQLKAHGVMMPEAEVRQRYPVNPDGSIGEDSTPKWVRDAIFAGIQKPNYSNIHTPVLAILAVPLPLDEQFKKYQPRTADERAAMEQKHAVGEAFTKRTVQDLKAGDENARIVTLPGASTYIFLSNENDTVREMRSFLQPMILGSPVQLAGHWKGTMLRDGAPLEVSFDFSGAGSQLKGTFTSATQQAMDYPLNVVTISGDGVHFALGDSVVFDGKLVSDRMVGTFTDSGASGNFTLYRSAPELLPYDSVDVIFRNGTVTLSGTLCLPRSPGRHAAVVILQGSGGESRWGTNRFIADQFARSGIAALVYDKRGSGVSTGDWKASSYDDLANDVLAGIDLLASRPDIDPSRIGLHGHSKVELSRRLLRFMLPLRSLL
jgi:pimeloyl-ACP methyl ester carboxylesterase